MNRLRNPWPGSAVAIGCVLLGVALRLAWWKEAQAEAFFYAHVQDAAAYHEFAQRVLAGELPFSEPFSLPPLYGLLLGAVYATLGVDPGSVYALQIGLSAVTIGLAVHVGRRLYGTVGAVTGGLVTAVNPASMVYDVRLVGVSVAAMLVMTAAAMAHRAWARGRGRDWAGTGLALGLASMVQGHLLVASVPLMMTAFWRGRLRCVAPLLLGLFVSVGPSVWHNQRASGEVIVGSLGAGITVYRGNNPYVQAAPVHPFRLPPTTDGLLRKSALIARIETQTDLTDAQADRYWLVRGGKHAVDAPKRAAGLAIRKLTQIFGAREHASGLNLGATIAGSEVLRRVPPLFAPAGVLALIGLIGTRRPRDAGVFAIVVGAMLGVVTVFVDASYRVPLVPLIGVYAGGGLSVLARALRARRRWVPVAWGLSAAALAVILQRGSASWVPWNAWVGPPVDAAPCTFDVQRPTRPSVAARFHLGVFALNHGRYADAEAAMWSVLKDDPEHTAAGVNLSGLLLNRGATAEAASIAEMMVAFDECDDKAWSNWATAKLRLGEFGAARTAARTAARIDPYNPGYWSLVGEAELALGATTTAQGLFERTVRWAPDLWQARARLGRIHLTAGRFDEATQHLQVAVSAQPGREELVGLLGLSEVGRGNRDGARALLKAAVNSGQRGPTLTALARALATPDGSP
ncbi:MAG: tetratricopeptide repeat protein [Myxococcota bacterium]|nr:tetratricopeptide repeat protein [Myxococcota bacterium]